MIFHLRVTFRSKVKYGSNDISAHFWLKRKFLGAIRKLSLSQPNVPPPCTLPPLGPSGSIGQDTRKKGDETEESEKVDDDDDDVDSDEEIATLLKNGK